MPPADIPVTVQPQKRYLVARYSDGYATPQSLAVYTTEEEADKIAIKLMEGNSRPVHIFVLHSTHRMGTPIKEIERED